MPFFFRKSYAALRQSRLKLASADFGAKPICIEDCDIAAIDLDQSFVCKTTQLSRNDLTYRPEVCREALVRLVENK